MRNTLLAILIVIVLGGLGYFAYRSFATNSNLNTNTSTNTTVDDNANLNSTIDDNSNAVLNSNTNTANTNASTNANSVQTSSVSIVSMSFQPATLTVAKNTKVTWINNDSLTHTVTGTGFDSGNLAPGATYSHTFTQTGTFTYHCTIHPSMTGTIIVQ